MAENQTTVSGQCRLIRQPQGNLAGVGLGARGGWLLGEGGASSLLPRATMQGQGKSRGLKGARPFPPRA